MKKGLCPNCGVGEPVYRTQKTVGWCQKCLEEHFAKKERKSKPKLRVAKGERKDRFNYREWYQKNREKILKRRRLYYQKNRISILKKQREFCKRNVKKIREYHRKYREKNLEKIRKYNTEYQRRRRKAKREKDK